MNLAPGEVKHEIYTRRFCLKSVSLYLFIIMLLILCTDVSKMHTNRTIIFFIETDI